MVTKPTVLTHEALQSFSLRIAGDGSGKIMDRVRGSAVAIDEDIPEVYLDDDKSVLGFGSVSEVGTALARNMVGTSSDHESLISEVQELINSLTRLLEKASELSEVSGESVIPSCLATFAEETHSKLNSLVESSFQVLEENDRDPTQSKSRRRRFAR